MLSNMKEVNNFFTLTQLHRCNVKIKYVQAHYFS